MSATQPLLSTQDLQDLHEIRSRLPQNDPRASKIDGLVRQHLSQPTQFEQENTPSQDSALSRGASGAWSALKSMVPSSAPSLKDIALQSMGPLPSMAANAVKTYGNERASGQGVIPSLGSAVGGSVGLDTEGIKERAQHGDAAGVIGEGIPSVLGTLLGGESEKIPAIKDSIGGALRTPEKNALKPWVKTVSRVGGAAAGHLAGIPGVGELGGMFVGPGIADMVIPDHPNPYGEFSKLPTRMKIPEMTEAGSPMGEMDTSAAATKKRLAPLIYESESHANQIDALNDRLKNEASKAGMFSAARGAVRKPLDYQERIGKKTWKPLQ